MDFLTVGVSVGLVVGGVLYRVLIFLSDKKIEFISKSLLTVLLVSCSTLGGVVSVFCQQNQKVVVREEFAGPGIEKQPEYATPGSIVVYDIHQEEFGGRGSYMLVIDVSDGYIQGLDEYGKVQFIAIEEVDYMYDPVFDPGTRTSVEAHTYLELLARNFSK